MTKKENKHTIEHQIINLDIEGIDDDNEINQVQQNFIYFYKEHIGKELDRVFDKIAPQDVDIQIDELTLDLGSFDFEEPADLEKAIIKKIKQIVERELKAKIGRMEKKAASKSGKRQRFSKMGVLEFFLINGYYPTWASTDNGTISDIFDDLTSRNAKHLVQRIFLLRKDKKVRERLYQQFSAAQLNVFFELLYGQKIHQAKKQIILLKKKLGQKSEKAILSAAINYVFDGSSALGTISYKERTFARHIIAEVQQRKVPSSAVKTKVRAGFEGRYQDIQILEYFLEYGAIPSWAAVESKQSLQELFHQLLERQLIDIQRMLERHADNSNFIQRLIFQFSTDKILQLLEPTPNENIKFIQASLKDLEFLTSNRQNIGQSISSSKLRTIVLTEVIDYFFLQKKNKFVKKTFVKLVLEELAIATQTPYEILVKESYKSVRRKKSDTAIRSTLDQLDEHLQQKLDVERKELRKAKKDYKVVEKELEKLLQKQAKGTISAIELGQLRAFSKKIRQLEQTMEELEDMDMPLDIEVLIQQRQALKNQLQFAQTQEQKILEKRLSTTEKEFKKLQDTLNKEVEKLLKDKNKLNSKVGSIAQQRIKRVNNRIGKYHRAIQNVVHQLKLDQKDIELFLVDINKALRGNITAEEKQHLRQERSRLQKELIKLNEYIEQLIAHEKELQEALKTTLTVVDNKGLDVVEPTGTSKLDALIFMLQYGASPWWAEDLPKQSIEELFLEFASKSPEKLRRALQQIGKYPVVWERTINQLSEQAIQTVLRQLYPNDIKTIFVQAELLYTIHFAQGFEALTDTERKKFQWGIIVEQLLSNRQAFNPQTFTKEVTLQIARAYNISPTKLIEYTNNIIKNKGGDFIPFLEWNEQLAKDKKVNALERELVLYAQEVQQKEEGTYLNNQQKLELLATFMSTGQLTTKAKELGYDSKEKFEHLLLEQIQINKAEATQVIFNSLRLSNVRNLIITEFSDDTFWEIVHLVRPKALLPVQRHFEDFKKIAGTTKLDLEKDVLFNLFLSQQQERFDPINYIKAIFLAKQQKTGRKILALLTETKRRIKSVLGTSSKSSWLISILMLEVEALKMEEKHAKDAELRANLNEQINFIAKEYTETSTVMVDILSEESAEYQGIPEQSYKLVELEAAIEKYSLELEALIKSAAEEQEKKETEKTGEEEKVDTTIEEGEKKRADALKRLENKRKIALYQAQLKLLKFRRPPLLRKVERQIRQLTASLADLALQLEAETAKNIQVEALMEEKAFELSLLERQIELQADLSKAMPSALQKLPTLLKDLEDEDHSHALFIQDLLALAPSIADVAYRQSLLEIIHQSAPKIVRLEDLKRSQQLDKQQQQLLQKINRVAPIQLWKEWEALEQYYAQNPSEHSPERAEIQQQIVKIIKRQDQKNLLAHGQMLSTAQKRLEKELNQATSLEALKKVQEQITLLWQQQQVQVDEMIEVVKDDKTKKDFIRLRANIDAIFTRFQNRRIKQSNAILTEEQDRLQQEKVKQTLKVKDLEQQKDFIVEEINKTETPPVVEPEVPKKKRKPKTPILAPIDEPLQVYNAGMVLLWPYIGRLFSMLGYVKKKEFVDIDAQYKAIHLLQYLVTGKTEAPENELLLNKIFCNFPITEPVPFGIEFTPDELKTAESLLGGVIHNWPKMKSMTPNSLRGSFLIREGTVKEEEGKWLLQVQKQTFDILLKTLPWSFTFIKFPWAEKFISVEWKLM
ncbi:contractile injection system tape measure protein [Aureispira anguillae]|uniref:Contractile injection system tape measure protein n=1 Tax=Aureispira anguillae TaxID=2864201 RepID=A0A915YJT1_9BACT|nr:contractile injection system tape measure protein [Aureispira anguillae]BDS14504.1 contractile injection system tape measure protein [Aureispira anguillae]